MMADFGLFQNSRKQESIRVRGGCGNWMPGVVPFRGLDERHEFIMLGTLEHNDLGYHQRRVLQLLRN